MKTEETGALTIDEKVRVSFKESRKPSERQIDFNNTVKLLKDAFPSEDLALGQLYTRWGRCSYIEHVLDLKDRFNEEADASKDFKASVEFCELLIPCQREVQWRIIPARFLFSDSEAQVSFRDESHDITTLCLRD